MGSSTGVAFHQLHPQPQEVLAKGLEAPGAANYVAASPVSWPGPPRRRESAAGQPGRHVTPRQRSAGEANIANADVVVGHLVAAPNVGNRDSRSPCRWKPDLENHRGPSVRLLLRTEVVGMSSLAARFVSRSLQGDPSRARRASDLPWADQMANWARANRYSLSPGNDVSIAARYQSCASSSLPSPWARAPR